MNNKKSLYLHFLRFTHKSKINKTFIPLILSLIFFLIFVDIIVYHPQDTVTASDEPEQTMLEEPLKWEKDGLIYEAVAEYKIKGKVLSTQKLRTSYSTNGGWNQTDLGIGWKEMSDQSIIDQFEFRPNFNSLSLNFKSRQNDLKSYSHYHRQFSNNHISPKDKKTSRMISKINVGEIVSLEGYLVNIYNSKNQRIATSSLSRTDTIKTRKTGDCEVFWVENVTKSKTGNERYGLRLFNILGQFPNFIIKL